MTELLALIVEDNHRNLKLARDVLQFHGFRTLEATAGREAIALAKANVPDVILLDIQLPDIDGVEVLCQLRHDTTTSRIPVIAVTAFAMKEDANRFLRAGFNGYIAKPIDVKTFADQVRECSKSPEK